MIVYHGCIFVDYGLKQFLKELRYYKMDDQIRIVNQEILEKVLVFQS